MFAKIAFPLLQSSLFNPRPDGLGREDDISSHYCNRRWRSSLFKMIEQYVDNENDNNFCRNIEIVISDRHYVSLDVKISPKFYSNDEFK